MRKLISLVAARCMFIRVRDPGLADRATSLKAVRDLRDAHVLGYALALANTEILQASLNQLNEAVHTYRIRLRGTLDRSKPPMEIDELEQQIGVLDVWENTLTCDGRVYRDIRCYKDEVEQESAGTVPTQEVPPKAPPPSGKDVKGFVAEFIEKTKERKKPDAAGGLERGQRWPSRRDTRAPVSRVWASGSDTPRRGRPRKKSSATWSKWTQIARRGPPAGRHLYLK